MAHSGTTILTHVLRHHPEVRLAVSGSEAWILENTWLPFEETEPIRQLLADDPSRRIILKRPWNCLYHSDWMAREMPKARFIYCYRSFEETAKSWSKTTSLVDEQLRDGGLDYQQTFYQFCLKKAEAFSRRVRFFRKVFHPSFVASPAHTMATLATWLGLTPFEFELSQVAYDKDIKGLLSTSG